jgi:hypothetical protein
MVMTDVFVLVNLFPFHCLLIILIHFSTLNFFLSILSFFGLGSYKTKK